jgi:Skp family chaperone for outer membrane proteins
MKIAIKIALLVLLVFPAGLTSGKEPVKKEGVKIGYIRLEEVFQGYYRTEQVLGQLKIELKEKEDEMQKLADEIRQMEEEMYLLSPEGRKKKEEGVQKRKLLFRKLKLDGEEKMAVKIQAAKDKLYDAIALVVKEKARIHGYGYVLNDKVMSYPLVIYGDSSFDLTEEVLAELNSDNTSK